MITYDNGRKRHIKGCLIVHVFRIWLSWISVLAKWKMRRLRLPLVNLMTWDYCIFCNVYSRQTYLWDLDTASRAVISVTLKKLNRNRIQNSVYYIIRFLIRIVRRRSLRKMCVNLLFRSISGCVRKWSARRCHAVARLLNTSCSNTITKFEVALWMSDVKAANIVSMVHQQTRTRPGIDAVQMDYRKLRHVPHRSVYN